MHPPCSLHSALPSPVTLPCYLILLVSRYLAIACCSLHSALPSPLSQPAGSSSLANLILPYHLLVLSHSALPSALACLALLTIASCLGIPFALSSSLPVPLCLSVPPCWNATPSLLECDPLPSCCAVCLRPTWRLHPARVFPLSRTTG